MKRIDAALGLQRGARIGTMAALLFSVAAGPVAAASLPALWTATGIAMPGSDNAICGAVHTNGAIDVPGSRDSVTGRCEYVTTFKANQKSPISAVKAAADANPLPRTLAEYRTLAKTQGIYSAGNIEISKSARTLSGVVFAEGHIHLSGSDISGTATLIAATGDVTFSGSRIRLTAAVDGVVAAAAQDKIAVPGSEQRFAGAFIAPRLEWPGSRSSLAADCSDPACASAPACGAEPCKTASDCDDHDACTTESCLAGVCSHTNIPNCGSCTSAADCGDDDACTTDSCEAGVCTNIAIPGCPSCEAPADCDDRNACTTDTCEAHACAHAPIPGCTTCTTDADCDDQSACTRDACQAGRCTHSEIANCTARQTEVCGDCIDNDGNGLVDYDDPACCSQVDSLALRRMAIMKPNIKLKGNKLRLKLLALYAKSKPAGFDPTKQDTTIQVSDERGSLVCATVTKEHWMRTGNHVGFCDLNGTFANGLHDGRFIFKNKGKSNVRFRTISQTLPIRPVVGGHLKITVRVGNSCTRESVWLTPTSRALVFP